MGDVLLYGFAAIGGELVLLGAFSFLREAIRSVRQGYRVAYVLRKIARSPMTLADWARCAIREFGSSYDTMCIGIYRIPHDPEKPITGIRY